MLQRMRQGAQSFGAKVLVALIILTLALFGFGAFNIFGSPDRSVASVDGEDIPESELQRAVERQRQNILAQLGPDTDPDLIDPALLERSALESLISRRLLVNAASDMNIVVPDERVDRVLVETPQFQRDGRFDPNLFRRLVANVGHTPSSFRRELTEDLMLSTLEEGLVGTSFAAEWELRQLAGLIYQQRHVAYLRLDPEEFSEEASEQVTEEDIEAYYDAYRSEFVTEERIDLEYVELTIDEVMDEIEVSDEELRELYEEQREQAATGAQRRAAHILLELNERSEEEAREQLRELEKRIAAGESFEALAREHSEDAGSARQGGDLGLIIRGTLDAGLEEAIWRLEEGEVSGPVRSDFGWHLVKLTEVRGETFPPFEEMEGELREEVAAVRARERFEERVRELDAWAFEAPDSLEPLAEEFGLEIERAEGVTREQGRGAFDEAELREEAFSSDVLEGLNSRAVTVGESAFVLRLREHYPSRQLPLEEVEDEIGERLRGERAVELARQARREAERRLHEGDAAGAVAQAFQGRWQVHESARRDSPGPPPAVTQRAFELPRPGKNGRSVGAVELEDGAQAVITVTGVIDGDWETIPRGERESLQRELREMTGNRDFEALFRGLRQQARIRRRG